MDRMLTLMQIAALAVGGMCHALLGSVKVPLARKLNIDEARVGGLVSVFGLTLIPMVLAAGFLVDSLGKQAVLAGGFVLLIVSLAMLARSADVSRRRWSPCWRSAPAGRHWSTCSTSPRRRRSCRRRTFRGAWPMP